MTRHFTLAQPHFIGSALLAAGSRITDADLPDTEPGSQLIETDAEGRASNPADARRLLQAAAFGSVAPQMISPVAPHAPNPTRPQAVPGFAPGEVPLAANQRNFHPAEGVESNEAAEARVERLKRELAEATALLDSARSAPEEEAPVRRAAASDAGGGADLLSGTVPDVEAGVAGINDEAEINRLIEAETSGRNRAGALAALESRRAQLAPEG